MAFADKSVCPSCAPYPCLPHLTFYPGPSHPLTCSIFALSLPHETKFRGQGLGLFRLQCTQAWHDQYCACLLKEWTDVQGEETRVLYPLTDLAGHELGQCLSWFRSLPLEGCGAFVFDTDTAGWAQGEACWHMSPLQQCSKRTITLHSGEIKQWKRNSIQAPTAVSNS